MALGAMPRPISYALSIVIVGIGLAVSYQVFLGSSFSYEGQLGSIQLGKGDNATTLAEFVEQSQEALTAAQASIASLEKENQELQQQLVAYEKTIDELKIAARKSEDTEVAASIASISDQVAAVAPVTTPKVSHSALIKQREMVEMQLKNTRFVSKLLQSEKK